MLMQTLWLVTCQSGIVMGIGEFWVAKCFNMQLRMLFISMVLMGEGGPTSKLHATLDFYVRKYLWKNVIQSGFIWVLYEVNKTIKEIETSQKDSDRIQPVLCKLSLFNSAYTE